MKKAVLVSIVAGLFFLGCGNIRDDDGIVYVRENLFITQITGIRLNHNDFIGRTIRLEGMFNFFEWEGNQFYFVIRNTPGCCGDDGEIGFELSWNPYHQSSDDGFAGRTIPNRNDWVEVLGVLQTYENFGHTFLYLALTELNVLDTRGAEFVRR